jgi:hypothetical protein
MEVSWRAAAGEEFPTEGIDETVVFLVHIECGFGGPSGRLLLRPSLFYRIELVRGDEDRGGYWCSFHLDLFIRVSVMEVPVLFPRSILVSSTSVRRLHTANHL